MSRNCHTFAIEKFHGKHAVAVGVEKQVKVFVFAHHEEAEPMDTIELDFYLSPQQEGTGRNSLEKNFKTPPDKTLQKNKTEWIFSNLQCLARFRMIKSNELNKIYLLKFMW